MVKNRKKKSGEGRQDQEMERQKGDSFDNALYDRKLEYENMQ